MAQKYDNTNFTELLFRFMAAEGPLLSMLEQLKKITRRTRVVGIFLNPESYLRPITI
jgi:hypothetical protein